MKRKMQMLAGGALALIASAGATAQGGEQYIGDIITVGFTFCPREFAEANGALLSIAQNTTLFSVIGCQYGGDCRTTFALPNLAGRTPVHFGQGPGLPMIPLAQMGGSETVTMTPDMMPQHTHTVRASTAAPMTTTPNGTTFGSFSSGPNRYGSETPDSPMQTTPQQTVSATGGSQPFSVVSPYTTIRYCVALQGIYPPRS